jgi:MFS family permease
MRFTGLRALEWNYLLSQMAVGMVTTFGVVYVYRLGESMGRGLIYLVGYYGCQRLATLLLLPVLADKIHQIGFRRVMGLALLGLMVKWLIMAAVTPASHGWLVVAALTGGFFLAGYNLGFEELFVLHNDNKRIGEQIGWFSLLQYLSLILAPVAAGLLMDKIGMGPVFGLGAFLAAVAVVPLWLMPHHPHEKDGMVLEEVAEFVGKEKRFMGTIISWHVTVAIGEFFWPLFVMMIQNSLVFLGALKSGVMVVSGLSAFFLGKVYDTRPLKRGFLIASFFEALIWVWRFTAATPLAAFGIDATGKMLSPVWWLKLKRYSVVVGERTKRSVYGVAQEIGVSLGLLGGLILGTWLIAIFGSDYRLLSVPAALGVIMRAWWMRGR